MAIGTPTSLYTAGGGSSSSIATGTITAAANAILIVVVSGNGNGHAAAPGMSGTSGLSGLSWTVLGTTSGTYSYLTALCAVTGSGGTGTLTYTDSSATPTVSGMSIDQITSVNQTTPVPTGQKNIGLLYSTSPSLALPNNPASTS